LAIVVTLVRDNDINPDSIKAIAKRKKEWARAAELGERLKRTNIDDLIAALEGARPSTQQPITPTPSRRPSPTPTGVTSTSAGRQSVLDAMRDKRQPVGVEK
jgi:hypothetical protein